MPLWLILCSFGVGVVLGYGLALHAASWGIRASTEARSDSKGLFEAQRGSPEVRMTEERERWLSGPTEYDADQRGGESE